MLSPLIPPLPTGGSDQIHDAHTLRYFFRSRLMCAGCENNKINTHFVCEMVY